ncbi:5903_t:CDS:2 [Diversispora eburnea]|uniref:5903_t:CDS:1 n=1 Tax=Diversispora eburnea TaxID=1213867 RepID=A0A9N8Z659_9GLOM|nr:5903_t:CDS:2 [Diversispora eburnea]
MSPHNYIKLQVYKVLQLLRRSKYEPAKRADSFGPSWEWLEMIHINTSLYNKLGLAIPIKKAWQLLYNFEIILDIAKELLHNSSKATQTLYTANK